MSDAAERRRRLPPAQRRAVIVEAAGRLFAEHGFDGTRLNDVAAAAGITKPILYRHFQDKTALYLGVLQRHGQDLDTFREAIPADGTLHQRLRAVLEVWLAYVEDHAYAWKMLFRDTGGGHEIQVFRAEVQQRAREVLADLIRVLSEHPIPQRELEPIAEMMRAGMASLALQQIDNVSPPRDTILDAMLRVWTSVLAKPDQGPAPELVTEIDE
jgi:AcrR family transcriptional regulator